MNIYTYKKINTIEELNETLDQSDIKPNWIIYPKLASLRKYAVNAFQHFAPIVLIFLNNEFIGGANIEHGVVIVYGLEGGMRITEKFNSDELNEIVKIINTDLTLETEEVHDITT